jgi:hypothetical protein
MTRSVRSSRALPGPRVLLRLIGLSLLTAALSLFVAPSALAAPSLTLSAPEQVTMPQAYAVHAHTSQDLTNSGYYVVIYGEPGDNAVDSCSTGDDCVLSEFPGWNYQHPRPETWRAKVFESATGAVVDDAEVTVEVRRPVFSVDLNFSDRVDHGGGYITYTATATASPAPDPNLWFLSLQLVATGGGHDSLLETCSLGSTDTCTTTVRTANAYRARVVWDSEYASSPTYTLSDTGPTDERADGVDVIQLAGLFSGPQAACDAMVNYPGTHDAGSSLTDQQLACESAVASGANTAQAIRAGAAIAGTGGLYWFLVGQAQAPTLPWAPPSQPYPGHPPASPPPTVVTQTYSLADRLLAANPTLDQAQADTIAAQCVWQLANAALNAANLCASLPVFVTGSTTPQATQHDLEAIAEWPLWSKLGYEEPQAKATRTPRRWYSNDPACAGASSDESLDCDEFPFFSTEQGGPEATRRPDLRVIDAGDNRSQGASLSAFYTACAMQTGTPRSQGNSVGGDPFLLIPVPPDLGVPTIGLCNGKGGQSG